MHMVDLRFACVLPIKRNNYTLKVFRDNKDKGKLMFWDLFHKGFMSL